MPLLRVLKFLERYEVEGTQIRGDILRALQLEPR
jgi:hypothetical protein